MTLDTSHRDLGLSAYKGTNRHKGALASFLGKIESGEIERGSYLIVENLDRLTREDVLSAVSLFLRIIEAGIVVATLNDDMIYSTRTIIDRPNDLTVSISAFIKGNREQKDKAERLKEAWDNKRSELGPGIRKKLTRQGPGWLCLIADDPTDPLVGEWHFNERAATVRRIFSLCVEGLGKEAIARRLNAEGERPFKHGDGWGMSAIAEILKDRRTIGELQLYTKVDGPRRPIGDPIKGYFPAVISDELFYLAQAEIAKRHSGASPGKTGKVPNIFVRLAHCQCRRSMEYRDRQSRSSPASVFLTCSGNRRGHQCQNSARFPYARLENLVLDWVTDIKVSDTEANNADIAGLKLNAKEAERDDTKRRLASAFAKWEQEEDGTIKDMLYASIQRYSAALPTIQAEIVELDETVRTTKRSVIDARRATVRKLRDEMVGVSGAALFDMRAKLAAALRRVIDRIEFHSDGAFDVTLRGGLKCYRFADGKFVKAIDLNAVNPKGADKLLTFPIGETTDAMKLAPMTLRGIRETLGEFASIQPA
ncbi:DNA invertase Pin-like site-specific DNA recombinase [Sphingomonas xinjiangensis]|uniref:DNA invertase Pin-like site-specific DNA recombinase n=1 Tax=Sphingomonas xinjiangensis TaxID=643568 RepID=A0A840YNX5_9SPHN|nr:DNA invertase Pin-like site-specific DNA recombinase [Sphingomonas xinjiangensis]